MSTTSLHFARRGFASVARSSAFAALKSEHIQHFRSILSANDVVTDRDTLAPMNTDWMNKYHGHSSLALFPSTSAQLSDILSYCNQLKLAVTPQSGNTGLVGGSVPVHDEIIVSLKKMNKVLSFDPVSGVLVCEAGCILDELSNKLLPHFIMPLDLGAKGSCLIGGNIATNAGGLRLVRYGSLHGTVLGLEVVLADGRVMDLLSTLRKDNTGYDLKQLFIGSEGTLGIITKCAIQVPRKPASTQLAFLACQSYQNVLQTMCMAREQLGEIVSAIEFQDRRALEVVLSHSTLRDPLAGVSPFYMIIETSGSNSAHDQEKLSAFLEKAMSEQLIADGTIADNQQQFNSLWQLRERVAEAAGKQGAVYKYDVSLPTPQMYQLVHDMRQHLSERLPARADGKPAFECVGYGHVGDGNLHLNIIVPKYEQQYLDAIEPFVFEKVASYRGSISAEHGIGVGKPHYLHHSKSPVAINIMHSMKHVFDPNGILNPYKVLPQQTPL